MDHVNRQAEQTRLLIPPDVVGQSTLPQISSQYFNIYREKLTFFSF